MQAKNKALVQTLALALVVSILAFGLLTKPSHVSAVSQLIGQISVHSPQNGSTIEQYFSVNFSFSIPTIQAASGVVAKAGSYLINDQASHSNLFQCFLLAGCALDSDRQKVLETVTNFEWNLDAFLALRSSSVNTILSYSGDDVYNGTASLFLPEGTHTLIIWVSAEQNYLSFAQNLWAGFSQTVTFTIDKMPTPPTISSLTPTLTPTPIQTTTPTFSPLSSPTESSSLTLEPTQTPTKQTTLEPSPTLSTSTSPPSISSPNTSPTFSPTEQPTMEPAVSPNSNAEYLIPVAIIGSLIIISSILAALFYLKRRK